MYYKKVNQMKKVINFSFVDIVRNDKKYVSPLYAHISILNEINLQENDCLSAKWLNIH